MEFHTREILSFGGGDDKIFIVYPSSGRMAGWVCRDRPAAEALARQLEALPWPPTYEEMPIHSQLLPLKALLDAHAEATSYFVRRLDKRLETLDKSLIAVQAERQKERRRNTMLDWLRKHWRRIKEFLEA